MPVIILVACPKDNQFVSISELRRISCLKLSQPVPKTTSLSESQRVCPKGSESVPKTTVESVSLNSQRVCVKYNQYVRNTTSLSPPAPPPPRALAIENRTSLSKAHIVGPNCKESVSTRPCPAQFQRVCDKYSDEYLRK